MTLHTIPSASRASGRDDRHLAADEDRIEEVATQPDDRSDEAELGDALGDQEATIDAGQTDGVDAEVAEAGDELAVDDAAEDCRGDLERLRVRHAKAALEPARDSEALEPFGDPLAAAVDEDHGTSSRDRGHFLEDLALVGDRRPAELDDEDLRHPGATITSCIPSFR